MSEARILFLGPHMRVVGIVREYSLIGSDTYVVADRFGTTFKVGPLMVKDAKTLDPKDFTHAIITEDPNNLFRDPIAFLKEMGFEASQIVTIGEPGKMHRVLRTICPFKNSPEAMRVLGYTLIRQSLIHRGNYAYCMILAAETAIRMNLKAISIIEFGVWFGDGLKNMCELADFIEETIGVKIYVFGFDTGAGLPDVVDWRDHPELWASGTLVMPNFEELATQMPERCELIIGHIKDTIHDFMKHPILQEAPIGFISLDVDQYKSSKDALQVLGGDVKILQPVIPVWVDDSYLSVLQTTWAGEGLAIREFNDEQPLRKIEQKIIRTDDFPRLWHHCIYFAHIFDHPVRQGTQKANFDMFYHTNY